ncbi:hypothetical protein L218DRAFT_333378 [Marasmius fiardii PR-910]|nr:hypothetical protein L218DRAFT_333378 [Marasmius fiardii PR-910]
MRQRADSLFFTFISISPPSYGSSHHLAVVMVYAPFGSPGSPRKSTTTFTLSMPLTRHFPSSQPLLHPDSLAA